MKQQTISDVEYSARKRKTKREEFLEIMDEIIPCVFLSSNLYMLARAGRSFKKLEIA